MYQWFLGSVSFKENCSWQHMSRRNLVSKLHCCPVLPEFTAVTHLLRSHAILGKSSSCVPMFLLCDALLRISRPASCIPCKCSLTHWGRVTHICVSKPTSIGSDNGLLPGRRQAIIWTNAWILLIGPLGTNFSEILIKILTFSIMKMCLKVSSAKWRPFCLGLNVLMVLGYQQVQYWLQRWRNLFKSVFNTIPLGLRPSAGTVMIIMVSYI